ncbi:MAG: hypothetical protein Q9220_005962 [cf. Caloplaca sp. 1 TL-2023]
MRVFAFLTFGSSLTTAAYAQVYKGFNYGSVYSENGLITQQNYVNQFNTAKQLQGTSGFTSARLFTMIQAGTTNNPTEAIPAAFSTDTQLLLGLFLSSTDEAFNNELTALRSAITNYGQTFAEHVIAISVGSEDLYRISPTGIINKSNPGEGPDAVVQRINAVRSAIAGTILSGKPVGHVDTWTAYVNSSNAAVIAACDFLGMDAYPYFQNTQENSIENSEALFFDAYNATVAVAQGKPVWITETGNPVSGPTENLSVPSLANAKTYWDRVGCRVFGQITTFWYTLQDAFPSTPSPSFGVVGTTLSTTPLFDLSCSASSSSSSKGTSSSTSATGSGSSVDTPSQGSGSGTGSSTTASAVAVTSVGATTLATVATPSASQPASGSVSGPSSTGSSCPAALSSGFEYPHLIVAVDKDQSNTALNTGYNGHFSPTVSTIFNFDIPPSDEGKTCSLVFLFPQRDELKTSNYTLSGSGGIDIVRLNDPATAETTYSNQPSVQQVVGSIPDVHAGNSYVIGSGPCYAGRRVGYKISATGNLDLDYFQNSDPEAIGLYITVC